MLIAVIADTHMPRGDRRLPARCAELIAGSDVLIHAGDLTGRSVLEELRELAPVVHAVHGNVDEPGLRRALPAELVLELEGRTLGVIHDAGPRRGRLRRLRARFPDCEAVVFGHSHMPLHETDGGFQIFNPGSPTERRRAPRRTMGLADVEGGEVRLRHLEL